MRPRMFALALATAVSTACGGNDTRTADTTRATPAPNAATPSSSTGATTAVTSAGKTWDVRMLGDDKGYRFDPASLTIKAGDTVKWTIVSGQPHNVTFSPDSIPNGAATPLGADMLNTSAPLSSPLLNGIGESYTITFAGVPAGTYRYYCTPHLALGMKGVLTIQ